MNFTTPEWTSSTLGYGPGGMLLVGRNWEDGSGYRYGFNSKENDDEIVGNNNAVDFGARIYDARLGKWLSIDLKASKFVSWSPYHFATNNPINFADKDGMDTLRMNLIEVATPFDNDIVLLKITFSLIQNGVERTVSTPPIEKEGWDKQKTPVSTNEYYFMMPREDWIGKNKMPDDVYDVNWKIMGSHSDWENTIFIQAIGRGQFAHPIKLSDESSGCLGPTGYPIQEKVNVKDNETNATIASYNQYWVGADKRGTLSYAILENIRSMYNYAEKYNWTGGKLGFQVVPRSEKTGGRPLEQIEMNGVDTIPSTSSDQS